MQKFSENGQIMLYLIKAYEQLSATSYNFISGNIYTVTDEAVEGIRNNVTLIFDEINFATYGMRKIQICRSMPLLTNTIQIRFNDETDESIQVVEFASSDEDTVQKFDLQNVGENK